MTPEEIKRRREAIAEADPLDLSRHWTAEERWLLREVLGCIADGAPNARELADAAICSLGSADSAEEDKLSWPDRVQWPGSAPELDAKKPPTP